MVNKTDKLDARGLNRLQRASTLPEVWIPPGELRDARELPRARMVLVRERTRLKQRVHATLAKYGLTVVGISDLFGVKGRAVLAKLLAQLPPQTRYEPPREVIARRPGETLMPRGRRRDVSHRNGPKAMRA